jgi:hypothetical protein
LLAEFGKNPRAKNYQKQEGLKSMEADENRRSADDLMEHMKKIVDALIAIEGTANQTDRMKKAEDYKFTIGKNQRVMIEDLLQVFVDHQEYLRTFLEYLIYTYGVNSPHELGKICGSNLYHRLLECYLFKH